MEKNQIGSKFISFEEAREFVRSLGLKSQGEWGKYCKSGKKPNNIPASPRSVYSENWENMGDWLGTGTVAPQNMVYLPYEEARNFVRKLGLKNRGEWQEYCKND
jgi:hypothetical protein